MISKVPYEDDQFKICVNQSLGSYLGPILDLQRECQAAKTFHHTLDR